MNFVDPSGLDPCWDEAGNEIKCPPAPDGPDEIIRIDVRGDPWNDLPRLRGNDFFELLPTPGTGGGQTIGGLNPLFTRNPAKPPNFWRGPTPPQFVPTEPAKLPPGWTIKPHIGPDGFKIGPDQDLDYFRKHGNHRPGSRAGLRAIEGIGKMIIIITNPSVYVIDIAPIVVCGPCMYSAIHGNHKFPVYKQ